jgi:hypothetical protein
MSLLEEEIVVIEGRIESDLIEDRSKIDKIIVKLDTISSQIQTLYDRLPRTEDKAHDKMQEVAQPVIDAVEKLTTEIEKKKKVFVQPKFSLNDLFKRKVVNRA